jgi:serine protease Do
VRIQTVTEEIAEGLGLDRPRGALVSKVTEGGPAEKGGIEQGDVVTDFDGRTLTVTLGRLEDAEQVAALDEAAPEAEADEPAPPPVVAGPLGLTLSDLSPALRSEFGIEEQVSGVVVTDVASDSAAAAKRVQAGDVIVEISQEPVATPADVEGRIAQLKSDGRKSALLLLANKDGDLRFVAVTLE